jgi:hypothetical protein
MTPNAAAFLSDRLAEFMRGNLYLEFHGRIVVAGPLSDNISLDRDGDFVFVIPDEIAEHRASALHI